jgi:hypothetical protein
MIDQGLLDKKVFAFYLGDANNGEGEDGKGGEAVSDPLHDETFAEIHR